MIKTAIVILNWNGKSFLEKFLPTLIKNTPKDDTEIIIADNNSTDNSIDFLNKNHKDLRQIIFDKNYGYTGGYNKALDQIDAQYFVLLNSDIEVSENWLSPLIELLDSNSEIAACQPKINSFDQKTNFEYAGAAGGFIDKFGYPFCRGRILDKTETDTNQYNDIRDVFWATGACLVIRADLFKKVGGLDDDFFAHMEEIDLCWRLKNAGYRIVCNPESMVYHVGGGTLPNNSPFKLYLNFRNNLFLLYKNLPQGKLLSRLLPRMILDGLSAIVFLLKFQFSNYFAVLKAHIHFYMSIKKLYKKRNEILSNTKEINHKEIYSRSIVIDYYLRKKKVFKSLNL